MYDESEASYLAADAADALEEIEREHRVAQRDFALGSMPLNEMMELTYQLLGITYYSQLDTIRYELAKKLTEENHA